MTPTTKRLLEQLTDHANKFRSNDPCLQLIPIAPLHDGQPYKIYPQDMKDAVDEILAMDTIVFSAAKSGWQL